MYAAASLLQSRCLTAESAPRTLQREGRYLGAGVVVTHQIFRSFLRARNIQRETNEKVGDTWSSGDDSNDGVIRRTDGDEHTRACKLL